MGIKGLLPFLKRASRETNIRQFAGCTVAIDAYCWLHKGVYGCAEKIAQKEPTTMHINYCLRNVNMLLSAGLKPIMVFDGRNLPAKAGTEHERRENRKKNLRKAQDLMLAGNPSEARQYFAAGVDITHEMAKQLIDACQAMNVDCIVAPYEADAQLAYLCRSGIAQVIVTEDSDLVLFGCTRIMFKMDSNGNGVMFESDKLNLCFGNKSSSFTFARFRQMCIMSGCDYLDSLPGVGLGKAEKFFRMANNPNLVQLLPKIPRYLSMPKLTVTKEYVDGFIQAENTFLHQVVFDPIGRRQRPLTDYSQNVDPKTLDYCGRYFDDETAYRCAVGVLNIRTGVSEGSFGTPTKCERADKPWLRSIWSRDYRPMDPALIPRPSAPTKRSHSDKSRTVIVAAPLFGPKRKIVEDDEPDLLDLYSKPAEPELPPVEPPKRSRFFESAVDESPPKTPTTSARGAFGWGDGNPFAKRFSTISTGSTAAANRPFKPVRPNRPSAESQSPPASLNSSLPNCSLDPESFGFSQAEELDDEEPIKCETSKINRFRSSIAQFALKK